MQRSTLRKTVSSTFNNHTLRHLTPTWMEIEVAGCVAQACMAAFIGVTPLERGLTTGWTTAKSAKPRHLTPDYGILLSLCAGTSDGI